MKADGVKSCGPSFVASGDEGHIFLVYLPGVLEIGWAREGEGEPLFVTYFLAPSSARL